jgi:hypothetical protein
VQLFCIAICNLAIGTGFCLVSASLLISRAIGCADRFPPPPTAYFSSDKQQTVLWNCSCLYPPDSTAYFDAAMPVSVQNCFE